MKVSQIITILFIILSVTLIADYVVPGKLHEEAVSNVEIKLEKSNRPSNNSQYHSFKVYAGEYGFYVSERFGSGIRTNDRIAFKTSLLFNQVNAYGHNSGSKMHTFSLRLASGLIFPLIALIIFILGLRMPEKMGLLVLITHVVLIVDAIFIWW